MLVQNSNSRILFHSQSSNNNKKKTSRQEIRTENSKNRQKKNPLSLAVQSHARQSEIQKKRVEKLRLQNHVKPKRTRVAKHSRGARSFVHSDAQVSTARAWVGAPPKTAAESRVAATLLRFVAKVGWNYGEWFFVAPLMCLVRSGDCRSVWGISLVLCWYVGFKVVLQERYVYKES